MSEHTHKCGFDIPRDLAYMIETEGCGYEWKHDPDNMDEAEMWSGHFCPNCRRGPWVWQYDKETIAGRLEGLNIQREALKHQLEIVPSNARGYAQAKQYLERICRVLNGT